MHTYMNTYMHAYTHTRTNAHTHVCVCVSMAVFLYEGMYLYSESIVFAVYLKELFK